MIRLAARVSPGRLISRHASIRMQQRGVPPAVLECLLAYGAEISDHHGADILFFDKRSWRRMARARGKYVEPELARYRNVYAVIGADGRVATVGRRYRRIRKT